MENEKVQYLINMINDMDIKDKLRLAICISQSKWSRFYIQYQRELWKIWYYAKKHWWRI